MLLTLVSSLVFFVLNYLVLISWPNFLALLCPNLRSPSFVLFCHNLSDPAFVFVLNCLVFALISFALPSSWSTSSWLCAAFVLPVLLVLWPIWALLCPLSSFVLCVCSQSCLSFGLAGLKGSKALAAVWSWQRHAATVFFLQVPVFACFL